MVKVVAFLPVKGTSERIKNNDEIILKKSIPETAILSEKSLTESWLSKEDEEAFSYLQKK